MAASKVLASPTTPFACLVEPDQVVVVAGQTRIAEIGVPADAEVALIGDHVAVLGPDGVLYVVDPLREAGPTVVAQLAVPAGSRIVAATTNHAILALPDGHAIVELLDRGGATFKRLPIRLELDACAPSGLPDRFLLAHGDVIEEWNAIARAPVRRYHLDRTIGAPIGGTARHVWAIAGDALVVIRRAGHSPPTRIALPEPAAVAIADGTGAVAIVGAITRRAWLVRLAERAITPLCDGPIDELALERTAAWVIDAAA